MNHVTIPSSWDRLDNLLTVQIRELMKAPRSSNTLLHGTGLTVSSGKCSWVQLSYSMCYKRQENSKGSRRFYPKKTAPRKWPGSKKKTFSALNGSGSLGATARPKVVQQETQSRSSADVSWVSKLKEHYDRQGKSEAVLDSKYKLKTTADGSFVYRIYVPELGREVEGEVAKSKKEAKQNACSQESSAFLAKENVTVRDIREVHPWDYWPVKQ